MRIGEASTTLFESDKMRDPRRAAAVAPSSLSGELFRATFSLQPRGPGAGERTPLITRTRCPPKVAEFKTDLSSTGDLSAVVPSQRTPTLGTRVARPWAPET